MKKLTVIIIAMVCVLSLTMQSHCYAFDFGSFFSNLIWGGASKNSSKTSSTKLTPVVVSAATTVKAYKMTSQLSSLRSRIGDSNFNTAMQRVQAKVDISKLSDDGLVALLEMANTHEDKFNAAYDRAKQAMGEDKLVETVNKNPTAAKQIIAKAATDEKFVEKWQTAAGSGISEDQLITLMAKDPKTGAAFLDAAADPEKFNQAVLNLTTLLEYKTFNDLAANAPATLAKLISLTVELGPDKVEGIKDYIPMADYAKNDPQSLVKALSLIKDMGGVDQFKKAMDRIGAMSWGSSGWDANGPIISQLSDNPQEFLNLCQTIVDVGGADNFCAYIDAIEESGVCSGGDLVDVIKNNPADFNDLIKTIHSMGVDNFKSYVSSKTMGPAEDPNQPRLDETAVMTSEDMLNLLKDKFKTDLKGFIADLKSFKGSQGNQPSNDSPAPGSSSGGSGAGSSGGYPASGAGEDTSTAPAQAATSTDTTPVQTPSTETPSTETPSTETPSTETPNTETPNTETPSTETPSTETPSTETPTTEKPTTVSPSDETPVSETPAALTPKTAVSGIETRTTEISSGNSPAPAAPAPVHIAAQENTIPQQQPQATAKDDTSHYTASVVAQTVEDHENKNPRTLTNVEEWIQRQSMEERH